MEKKIITKTFKSLNGVISTWFYEEDKLNLGPFKVLIKYPDDYTSDAEDIRNKNKKLPKTKQKYFNPANGKMIGYNRAVQLGLIK